jgi:hypothetical protein
MVNREIWQDINDTLRELEPESSKDDRLDSETLESPRTQRIAQALLMEGDQ